MKPAKRKKINSGSILLHILTWPLVIVLFVVFFQVYFWLSPCESGLFVAGCGLEILALYAGAVYGILVYILFLGVSLFIRFRRHHMISLTNGESIKIGIGSLICGAVFLPFFPFYNLFKGVFEIVFVAADKHYIPSFFFESGKLGLRIY
jgi:hypothetical protein